MIKKSVLLVLVVLLSLSAKTQSNKVSSEVAKQVAQNLISQRNPKIVDQKEAPTVSPIVNKTNATLFYVVNFHGEGWVVVSGIYAATPIIAYSSVGTLSIENLSIPFPLNVLFDSYISEIEELMETKASIAPEIQNQWDKWSKPSKNIETIVGPLITSKWDQTNHYNDNCPTANQGSNAWLYGNNCVTGCVPLAMAMIIKHHKYPATDNNGVSYNYLTMPNQLADGTHDDYILLSSVTVAQKDEVAKLIYNCGVAAGTTYSSSSPLDSPTSDANVSGAFKNRFNYPAANVSNLLQKSGYTTSSWDALLRTELDNNRPVYYRGGASGSGHAWVIDGYDSGTNKYHCNWGYGVTHNKVDGFKWATDTWDGYFALTNLSPKVGRDHTPSQACITIKPATSATVAVTGITVNSAGNVSTITTNHGTLQLSALIAPSNATNQTVTWTVVPGTGTATISTSGLLTASTNGTVTVKATANDGSGIFGTKQITLSNQAVNVEQYEQLSTVTFYPNPVENILTIDLSSNSSLPELIWISDVTGKVVRQLIPNESIVKIDISDLCKGVYLLNVNNNQTKTTYKLVH